MPFWTLILVIALGTLSYTLWNYLRVRRAATFLDNASFEEKIHGGQLIDIREAGSFRSKHILGARNLPASQLATSLSAIRKDKPVLLYDSSRGTSTMRAVLLLKKAGYTDIYVLKDGIEYWTGKVKEQA